LSIVVGAFFYNSASFDLVDQNAGTTSVQDSFVAVMDSSFTNCSALSLSSGPALGTTSVYGGAVAVLHSPQVSIFQKGVSQPFYFLIPLNLTGFNFTFLVGNSNFSLCRAVTNSTLVSPGTANGGGGAVYANSVAFANVSLQSSAFNSCSVTVAIGAIGIPVSNSSGGGVSLEFPSGNNASVLLTSNTFWNCSANGADQYSPFVAVRGGGVAVFRAVVIKVATTSFSACSIAGASGGAGVSGGASFSAVFVQSAFMTDSSTYGGTGPLQSGTYADLILLSSSSTPIQVSLERCSFSSTIVSLNVNCVDANTGFTYVSCVKPGPSISVLNSNISQLAPAIDGTDFASIGSTMISLQQNVSIVSSSSLIMCNITQFAVFRKLSLDNVLYSCSPCPFFQLARTSNIVLLETASTAQSINQCMPLPSPSSCPFGTAACTTFVNVTAGFWASFTSLSSGTTEPLTNAVRCPAGYCGCGDSSSCLLPPPLSNARDPNPLCTGNRSGVLCGGCISGFTQSLDGRTCISNQLCLQNLWWVWALSVLWWALIGLVIVISSFRQSSGAISCLLFFFQMSSFAFVVDESPVARGSKWAVLTSQFDTIFSATSISCWAPNLSAYDVTVARLIGPCFVLLFAVAWTRLLQELKGRLLRRGVEVGVSYSGTLAVTLLFVFSNVASVVFKLVTCTRNGVDSVVFIDGSVQCHGVTWWILIGFAVLLCFFPIAFATALWLNKLSEQARFAVCRAYTERLFYWGAVTLGFRLLMSITPLLVPVDYPNVSAFMHSILSGLMFGLLVHHRPYMAVHTFWIDLSCYLCLIAQFGLQAIISTRDALGSLQLPSLFYSAELCSVVFR
jgi:hypothetical protein